MGILEEKLNYKKNFASRDIKNEIKESMKVMKDILNDKEFIKSFEDLIIQTNNLGNTTFSPEKHFVYEDENEDEVPTLIPNENTIDDIIGGTQTKSIDSMIDDLNKKNKLTNNEKNKILRNKIDNFNADTDKVWNKKMAMRMKMGNGSATPFDTTKIDLSNEYKKIEEATIESILNDDDDDDVEY